MAACLSVNRKACLREEMLSWHGMPCEQEGSTPSSITRQIAGCPRLAQRRHARGRSLRSAGACQRSRMLLFWRRRALATEGKRGGRPSRPAEQCSAHRPIHNCAHRSQAARDGLRLPTPKQGLAGGRAHVQATCQCTAGGRRRGTALASWSGCRWCALGRGRCGDLQRLLCHLAAALLETLWAAQMLRWTCEIKCLGTSNTPFSKNPGLQATGSADLRPYGTDAVSQQV